MVSGYKTIWRISFPIFLSLLAQNLIIVVDTAFLGSVGELELGASAIGGLFYVCMFIIGFGFATGTQILIGRRNGEKNYQQIGIYVDHTLYFLLVLAIFLMLFTRFFASGVLHRILSSENIYLYSVRFLDIRIWGLLFAFINMAYRAFYIGITQTRYLIYSALIMAVVNIVLDYLLIFGNYGFPKMGIEGAALASVIAEGASVIFFILITLIKIDRIKYQLFFFRQLNLQIIKKTFDVSFFVMLQFFVSIATWFTFFLIMEQMGERPLASSNIIRSLYMIFTIPIFSLGSATNTMVSNLLGENKVNEILPTIYRVCKISFLSILSIVIIALIFRKQILSFYTADVSLIEFTLGPFYVVMGVFLLFSLSIILFNGVTGTANTRISLLIELIAITIYLSMAYYIAIVLKLSTQTVWFSEFVYFGILGILSIIYLKKGNWMNKKV